MIAVEITAKLTAFARRRQKLIMERGLCATAATLLGGLGICAAADWLFLLDDPVRYVMSAAAWATGAYALWRTCLRPLQHSTDPKRLALLIEAARPELREQLVSAVELGEEDGLPHWDSPVFRELLQQDVARRVNPLEIDSLLPLALVKRWVRTAGAIAALMLLLLLVPGLHFGTLLLRALNPTANIDRVSNVKIAVVEPETGSAKVAANDQVSVVVDIAGAEAPEVFLDTMRTDGAGGRVKMQRIGRSRYAAEIAMRTSPVKFRVRAGDGVTKKYTLSPFPRPQVAAFSKTYHFPAYTRRADTNVVEAGGDLDALQGSTVLLVVEADQPVASGELNFDIADKTNSTPLEKISATKLAATVPMNQSGLYKVRLVGADTGFENKFSPVYEIRVQTDLLPTITLDDPSHDQVVMQDDKLDLAGTVRDDVGLARVDQFIQVNEGAWKPVPLSTNLPEREAKLSKNWDMFTMGVKAGDRIATKLVATDWKGNRGESTILRLLVGSTGVDAAERRKIAALRDVREEMQKLKQQADEVRKEAEEAERTAEPKQAALKLAAETEKLEQAAEAVKEQIKEALRDIPDGQDAKDLVNMGRLASRMEHENLEMAADQFERVQQMQDDKTARSTVHDAVERLKRADEKAEMLARTTDALLAAKESNVDASDLAQLAREEKRITESAQSAQEDEERQQQVLERQRQADKQVAAMQDQLAMLAEETKGSHEWEVNATSKKLNEALREAQKKLPEHTEDLPADKLRESVERMQRGVEEAQQKMEHIARALAERAQNSRRDLAQSLGDSSRDVERAHQKLAEAKWAPNADAPAKQEKVAQADDALKATAEQLRDRAALDELRNDSDAAFERDLSQTAAALDAVRERPAPQSKEENKNPVLDLAKALATLETGHEVGQAANELAEMSAEERFGNDEARERAEQAQEFRTLANQEREQTQNDLNHANAPDAAKQDFANAFNSPEAQQARQEMDNRANNAGQKNAQIAKPLQKMADDVAKARQDLEPAMRDARDMIASLAPALADRMKALASAERRQQEKTDEAAKAPNPTPESAQAQLAKQEALNERLDDLKDALRYDAAAQNLRSEEGRERARDADDALAMIRKPEQAAGQHLENAAAASQADQRAKELDAAQAEQGNLANTLDQLAQHYENLEAGHPEETRTALRAAEGEEMKTALDAQYGKAAEIAALQDQAPQDALAALQAQLANDPVMRTELGAIAKDNLQDAADTLAQAVAGEQQIAQNLNQLAQQNPPPANLADQVHGQQGQQQAIQASTDTAAQDITAAGQEQAALGVQQGEAMQQVGQETKATAAGPMEQAEQQLGSAQQPQAAAPGVQAAQGSAQKNLSDLNALRGQMAQTPGHQEAETPAEAASQWMAHAMDQLLRGPQGQPAQAMSQAQQQMSRQLAMQREDLRRVGLSQPGNAIVAAAAQPDQAMNGAQVKIGDWGNLPKRMAQDLMSAEHDGVSEEYRGQVDAYFRAITAKAKAKK